MNKRNVLTNIGALAVFINTVYPGLDFNQVSAAVMDGSWLSHLINLGMMYYLYVDGKDITSTSLTSLQEM